MHLARREVRKQGRCLCFKMAARFPFLGTTDFSHQCELVSHYSMWCSGMVVALCGGGERPAIVRSRRRSVSDFLRRNVMTTVYCMMSTMRL